MHKGIHPKFMKPPKMPETHKARVLHAVGLKPPRLKVPRNIEPKHDASI